MPKREQIGGPAAGWALTASRSPFGALRVSLARFSGHCGPLAGLGVDYYCPASSKPKTGKRGGWNRKDYLLTRDMAKEMAMVERTEQGRLPALPDPIVQRSNSELRSLFRTGLFKSPPSPSAPQRNPGAGNTNKSGPSEERSIFRPVRRVSGPGNTFAQDYGTGEPFSAVRRPS